MPLTPFEDSIDFFADPGRWTRTRSVRMWR